MGWCHEFGVDIVDSCDHPMVPHGQSCRCEVCGVVCEGRFKGCGQVWERGPLEIEIVRSPPTGRRGRTRSTDRSPGGTEAPAEIDLASPPDPAAVDVARHEPNGQVSDAVAYAAYNAHASSNGNGAGGAPGTEGVTLGMAVDRLRGRLRDLELILGSDSEAQLAERAGRLTKELPRRVGSAIARAVETGEDGDLQYLEHLEALVAATISTVRSRTAALVADDHPTSP